MFSGRLNGVVIFSSPTLLIQSQRPKIVGQQIDKWKNRTSEVFQNLGRNKLIGGYNSVALKYCNMIIIKKDDRTSDIFKGVRYLVQRNALTMLTIISARCVSQTKEVILLCNGCSCKCLNIVPSINDSKGITLPIIWNREKVDVINVGYIAGGHVHTISRNLKQAKPYERYFIQTTFLASLIYLCCMILE